MKVLASYPEGRATVSAMNADLAILSTSGPAWADRLKRMAARLPGLDIFSQGLVVRDDAGWQITDEGMVVLCLLEAPVQSKPQLEIVPVIATVTPPVVVGPAVNALAPLVGLKDRNRRRRRAVKMGRIA